MARALTATKTTTTDLSLIAAFAALIAVSSLIAPIPIGGMVPITLQTFAVLLTGAVLGAKRAFLATIAYVALGAAGLPIFAGGTAGPGVLLGPTGGYLVGFITGATLCGFIVERLGGRATNVIFVFAAGLVSSIIFIHGFGILGLAVNGGMSIHDAFFIDLPFWIGDLLKNALMAFVAAAVHRAFPTILVRR